MTTDCDSFTIWANFHCFWVKVAWLCEIPATSPHFSNLFNVNFDVLVFEKTEKKQKRQAAMANLKKHKTVINV